MTELDITQLNDVVREQSLRVQAAAAEIRKVIVGQPALVDRLLITLLCRGHLLVEGVPGDGFAGGRLSVWLMHGTIP